MAVKKEQKSQCISYAIVNKLWIQILCHQNFPVPAKMIKINHFIKGGTKMNMMIVGGIFILAVVLAASVGCLIRKVKSGKGGERKKWGREIFLFLLW